MPILGVSEEKQLLIDLVISRQKSMCPSPPPFPRPSVLLASCMGYCSWTATVREGGGGDIDRRQGRWIICAVIKVEARNVWELLLLGQASLLYTLRILQSIYSRFSDSDISLSFLSFPFLYLSFSIIFHSLFLSFSLFSTSLSMSIVLWHCSH